MSSKSPTKFSHREPIGSSTYPMPAAPFDALWMDKSLSALESHPTGTLYLHIPFCDQICSFCAFNKSVSNEETKERYVKSLLREIAAYGSTAYVRSLNLRAVYLGGGTPNALSAQQLDRILKAIRSHMPLSADCEITCEGVIQNFDPERVAALKANGVNRVSAGIQTFNRDIRANHLHMRNDKASLLASIAALQGHFDNYNLDFIYNLPGQTDAIWAEDLALAMNSGSAHLTIYPLVLLERTAFYSDFVKTGKHEAPDEQREISLFEYTLAQMEGSRYTSRYSVRDWAKPGFECQYIQLNARGNHVLALGAGAHGFVAGASYRNVANTGRYMEMVGQGQLPIEHMCIATPMQKMQRWMVMGLRMRDFDVAPFADRFGVSVEQAFGERIEAMVKSGYLKFDGRSLSFTALGDIYANNVRSFFEGERTTVVGYSDTTGIDSTGKSHYSAITRVKAAADVEANS